MGSNGEDNVMGKYKRSTKVENRLDMSVGLTVGEFLFNYK